MEIEDIQAFVEVASSGGLSPAAKRLALPSLRRPSMTLAA